MGEGEVVKDIEEEDVQVVGTAIVEEEEVEDIRVEEGEEGEVVEEITTVHERST